MYWVLVGLADLIRLILQQLGDISRSLSWENQSHLSSTISVSKTAFQSLVCKMHEEICRTKSTWYLVTASAQFHRMTPSLGQLPPWSSWYPPQVRMSLARVCSTDTWPLSGHFSLIFQIYISRSLRHVFSRSLRSLMQPTSREWGPQAFHHSHWAIRLLGLKSGNCNAGNCIEPCIYVCISKVAVNIVVPKYWWILIKRSSLKGSFGWLMLTLKQRLDSFHSLIFLALFYACQVHLCHTRFFFTRPISLDDPWIHVPSSSSLDLGVVVSLITHAFTSQDLQNADTSKCNTNYHVSSRGKKQVHS